MASSNILATIAAAFIFLSSSPPGAQPCGDILKMKSPGSDQETILTVKNSTASAMTYDWINFAGERENYGRVGPGETATIRTFTGHAWAFSNEKNVCVEGFVPTASKNSFTLTSSEPTKIKPAKTVKKTLTPTNSYTTKEINGFRIFINPEIKNDQGLLIEVLAELAKQIETVVQVFPEEKVAALKSVVIWVELNDDPEHVAVFFNSRKWLVEQGWNPEKFRSLGILNAKSFVERARRNNPMIVLHELAHAYHFKFAGKLDKQITRAYKAALAGKTYENVAYRSGQNQRAYALTSSEEYFAELTEAYFGQNDFFPFNRQDLEKHDPAGYQLMTLAWDSR